MVSGVAVVITASMVMTMSTPSFFEQEEGSKSITAVVVTHVEDCTTAALAADFLLWPSVQRVVQERVILTKGPRQRSPRELQTAAALIRGSLRIANPWEQFQLRSLSPGSAASVLIFDHRKQLLFAARLTHDPLHKRLLAAAIRSSVEMIVVEPTR